ncbi:potassium channel family protein [Streptomyces racemochromogenes]|uniref:Potassium channel family protein n=1 Tax=Streptomyces racemochromogenes TaxID=67353 RepID=A0ABW7PBD4_9ACTN
MGIAPEGRNEFGGSVAEGDSDRLKRFDARMRLPMVASAILPLVVVPEPGEWLSATVNVAAWLVFLADYVVRVRHLERYASSALGRFDLFVVIATAPWFLLPAAEAGRFVIVLRLARLARLLLAARGARRLLARLERLAVVAGCVALVAVMVAYRAERPVNPEFATFGDALWWGVVTLTTVGYGDITPQTPAGRWAGFTIMITGLAVLGLLAGSLASFFGGEDGEKPLTDPGGPAQETGAQPAPAALEPLEALRAEIATLRGQVEILTRAVARAGTHLPRPGDGGGIDPPH